jgi:alpha-D-xyloside xylohydrolase
VSGLKYAAAGLVCVLSSTALGATEVLESDLLRLEVTTGSSYGYRLLEKSTSQVLLIQNQSRFTISGTARTVSSTNGTPIRTASSLQVGLTMSGTSQTATVLFTFTQADVLQVDLWHNAGTATTTRERFTDQNENYYGLTEYPFAAGALDNRGLDRDFFGNPAISWVSTGFCNARAPFYFTTRKYGIYTESDAFGHYTVAVSGNTSFSFNESRLKYHILYGRPPQILQSYTTIAGGVYMPPDWAFGVIWWRDDHYQDLDGLASAQERVLEDARMLQQLGIPSAGMWIDRPYTAPHGSWGWGGLDTGHDNILFDPNSGGFPDPAAMVSELNDRGLQLMTWISNRMAYEMYDEALARGFLFAGYQASGNAADLSIPAAYAWFRDRLHTLNVLGTRGYKIDRGDEGEMPNSVENRNTVLCHQAAADSVGNTPEGPNNALIFARNTFDKSRRFCGVWNGDTESRWDGLQISVKNVLRCANINFHMWGSDTGGYGQYPTKELFARWLAFSAYTPIMEILQGPGRTIWDDYDQTIFDLGYIARIYCRTHHELIPYVRSHLYAATRTGLGVIRPLHVMFPDDANVLDMWDEYMYGNALLVAPVVQAGATGRSVYLPVATGTDNRPWLNYNDKTTIYEPGQTPTIAADVYTIPVLLRAGEIIVRGDILQANQRGSDWMGPVWSPSLMVEAFVGPGDIDTFFDYYMGAGAVPAVKRISLTKDSTTLHVTLDFPLASESTTRLVLYVDPTTAAQFASGALHIYVNNLPADGAMRSGLGGRRLEYVPVRTSADLDGDGDVDGDDFNLLWSCTGGPGADYAAGCQLPPGLDGRVVADFDEDNDVDQSDFGVFQRCLSGSGIGAEEGCDR